MNNKLYIIGNGFDLFHELNSDYNDFKIFVDQNDQEMAYYLESYFSCDLWSDFERNLAKLDISQVFFANSELLPDEESDRDGDRYQHPDMMSHILKKITVELIDKLNDWICSFSYPLNPICKLVIDTDSQYLSFNYSETLELYYGIRKENILYIHGKAEERPVPKPDEIGITEYHSDLILGHSQEKISAGSIKLPKYGIASIILPESLRNIEPYFKASFKDSSKIINEHSSFFGMLESVDKVIIIGHSLSDVDIMYLRLISRSINENSQWLISYHNQKALNKLMTQARKFVLPNHIVKFQNLYRDKNFT